MHRISRGATRRGSCAWLLSCRPRPTFASFRAAAAPSADFSISLPGEKLRRARGERQSLFVAGVKHHSPQTNRSDFESRAWVPCSVSRRPAWAVTSKPGTDASDGGDLPRQRRSLDQPERRPQSTDHLPNGRELASSLSALLTGFAPSSASIDSTLLFR
jgi:hypothetical protein